MCNKVTFAAAGAVILTLLLSGCVARSLATGDAAVDNGDYAAAAAAYEQGMADGDAAAVFALAVLTASGQGVPRDETRAVELFKQAADMGSAQAHAALGYRYLTGQGVEQDSTAALRHLLTAAVKGEAAAWFTLSRMFATGQGVAPDPETAEFCYLMARAHGFEVTLPGQ